PVRASPQRAIVKRRPDRPGPLWPRPDKLFRLALKGTAPISSPRGRRTKRQHAAGLNARSFILFFRLSSVFTSSLPPTRSSDNWDPPPTGSAPVPTACHQPRKLSSGPPPLPH